MAGIAKMGCEGLHRPLAFCSHPLEVLIRDLEQVARVVVDEVVAETNLSCAPSVGTHQDVSIP